jgi:ABC-type antimicrobial peptide transport system permease subunit
LWAARFSAGLLSIFALVAVLLCAVGIYGVVGYTVGLRVREIGIRLALGARRTQVRTMILSHGMQLLLVGAAIGLVTAIGLSKFLQRILFETNGPNTEVYLAVGIIMLIATLFASWIPARRASRVDPIVALRQD